MPSDEGAAKQNIFAVVSKRLRDDELVELVYRQDTGETAFAISHQGNHRVEETVDVDGTVLHPVSGRNNLIKHSAVLLPEHPEPYGSVPQLVDAIAGYIHRYVDISECFERIASAYVLLTWVHDAFNELPYLRFRGDFGSGKTRALAVIGSLCYKAFFASGASTVSPIFHTLDLFRGTLIIDEADFRFSDEKSELVKILNNGNVRGFPVLRTAMTARREFDPRAFSVFGPKIVAMRRAFDDPALESRFLTEEMGQRPLRTDIPINLTDVQKVEALQLRNQLLMYRFDTLTRVQVNGDLADAGLSPRLNQILIPLLSIVEDPTLQEHIRASLKPLERTLYAERASSNEAAVLEILWQQFEVLEKSSIPIAEVTTAFAERFGAENGRPVTNRFIGSILRKGLHLITYKSHGVYVLPASEKPKVEELCIRYGLRERSPPA